MIKLVDEMRPGDWICERHFNFVVIYVGPHEEPSRRNLIVLHSSGKIGRTNWWYHGTFNVVE